MYCYHCGQQLSNGAKFCSKCGEPQKTSAPPERLVSSRVVVEQKKPAKPVFKPLNKPVVGPVKRPPEKPIFKPAEEPVAEPVAETMVNPLIEPAEQPVIEPVVEPVAEPEIVEVKPDVESLVKEAEEKLAAGDFAGVFGKCDEITEAEPSNLKVYLFRLMADLKCERKEQLSEQMLPFDDNPYYLKAIENGDDQLKAELQGYLSAISERNNAKLDHLQTGDIFFLGTDKNGKRMCWKVIRKQVRKVLAVSIDNLCEMKYQNSGGVITWKDCTLRKWLNTEFLEGYFTPEEAVRIHMGFVIGERNPEWGTSGGDSSRDKIFVLGYKEAKNLFEDDAARDNGSKWWLRTPGHGPSSAAFVNAGGAIDLKGRSVGETIGVRPAMWLRVIE